MSTMQWVRAWLGHPLGWIFLAFGTAIVYGCTESVVENVAQSKCLARGYARTEVTFTLTPYCINRVNQTDVVVPL